MHHSRLMALLSGGASFVCYAPPGEGLAGAAGADGGGGGGGAGGQQQNNGQQQQQQAWTPPQGLDVPKDFLGSSAEDTLGKVLKGYGELNTRAEGLRTELGKKGAAPAKPEDYTFTPGEKIAPYFGDVTKNPALQAAKGVFHKHGISQQAFEGVINDLYGGMAEQGILAAPYSAKAEMDRYGAEHGLDATKRLQAFTENETFAKGLIGQLEGIPEKLKADAEAELLALTDTAGGQTLLRALMGRMAKAGYIPPAGAGANGGVMTDSEFQALSSDPRIDPVNENHKDATRRYDPTLRQKWSDENARRASLKQAART